MNQFNYEEDLGNYLVGSDLLQNSWAAILELYKQMSQTHPNLPYSVTYKRFNAETDVTVIAFVCSPVCNIQNLQGEDGDLVSSDTLIETFKFRLFDSSYSMNKAAVHLYQSLHAQLVQEKIDIAKP
ncbi:hypothetical protein AG4045_016311 [Apium graveolens]|uniref:Uncharacterized protein n=1 Tax=Apium graveolens TaxID=4045 RepID=A0A6L5B749_APIGR|nr:hypothetical protein AG4045_016311 [Apium graveolens]